MKTFESKPIKIEAKTRKKTLMEEIRLALEKVSKEIFLF